ncbi:MAG: sulfotransferase, partial [Woeseiaceae bacterium]|nr:sulfotransferase [Woeseiaceae bacterium]
HLTDKLPHNFLNVGIIRILFPSARIVHCRRDARDTCFSIYKNLFGTHPYTFDLEELGRYYNEYRALMAHWDEILPGAMHSVDYETMIADQEATTRGLLEACGLDWDPNCLEFFRHDRSIPTISATQVQQPIYGSSVAAWENYADMLEPLLAVLDD